MDKSLLIVDDDEMLRAQLAIALSARGFQISTAGNVTEARTHLDAELDFAIIDLKMPGESGLFVLKELKQRSPRTVAIVLTGYGSISNAVDAMRMGAVNYVTKPADVDQILEAFQIDEPDNLQLNASDMQRPSLAEAEWNHIQRVLSDCDGNVTHAAQILGIPRRTLQRKLKKRAP